VTPPSKVAVAVHVHRVWTATQRRELAYSELAEAKAAARAAGIAPKAISAALAAMRRGQPGTDPAVVAIIEAVQSVPILDVEIGSPHGGALFPTT
jgi:uncharacterized protein YraI